MKQVATLDKLLKNRESVTTELTAPPTKALSVRIDINRYQALKQLAAYFEMSHKDVLIEGLDMWITAQQNKLGQIQTERDKLNLDPK